MKIKAEFDLSDYGDEYGDSWAEIIKEKMTDKIMEQVAENPEMIKMIEHVKSLAVSKLLKAFEKEGDK